MLESYWLIFGRWKIIAWICGRSNNVRVPPKIPNQTKAWLLTMVTPPIPVWMRFLSFCLNHEPESKWNTHLRKKNKQSEDKER